MRAVVLGAGLGGLSAAWVLAEAGRPVRLIEQAAENGGLAVTKTRGGRSYDLGPHNLHTRHAHILEFLRSHFPSLYEHFPTVHVWKGRGLLSYPMRLSGIFRAMPPWKLPLAAAALVAARATPRGPERSFADWIKNRFGRVIYREFFHDYPRKVWRLPTEEIDKVVAEKRVPTSAKRERPRDFLLGGGVGEMARFFEARARAAGAEVTNGARPTRIVRHENRVIAVETPGERIPCDALLSTIPLNDFVGLFEDVPADVAAAARALDYCATVLLFLVVERPLPTTVLYFTEAAVRFSRVSELPAGGGLWCLEFPCAVGDETWQAPAERLAAHAASVLRERGLVDGVGEAFVERVSHAYPRFRVGYAAHVEKCRAFLSTIENVRSYGRQGGFEYINTDTVMHQGFEAARAVLAW